MNKHEYRHYLRKGEERLDYPVEVDQLRKKVLEIGRVISKIKSDSDNGWKGGVKSTSYRYSSDSLSWGGWSADCESMWSLTAEGAVVARVYDCHGQGWFEFMNVKTIDKIYDQVMAFKSEYDSNIADTSSHQ